VAALPFASAAPAAALAAALAEAGAAAAANARAGGAVAVHAAAAEAPTSYEGAAEGMSHEQAASTLIEYGFNRDRVLAALKRCDGRFQNAMEELFAEWQPEGHAWIGQHVTLTFEGNPIDAVVTMWTPADGPRIPAMWQVVHTDGGKEEQLNEAEMLAALELFEQTPPMETPKAMGQGVTPAASRVPLAGSAVPESGSAVDSEVDHPQESRPTLLYEQISQMTVFQIKAALKRLGLKPLPGIKHVLVQQLEEAKTSADQDHCIRKNASRQQLDAHIDKLKGDGFEIFNVKPDGACFFRCMAKHFVDNEEAHAYYRTSVASSLGEYKDHIGIFLAKEDESVDAAITRFAAEIQHPHEWVGDEGITASALVLGVNIAVHDATHKEPVMYRGNLAQEPSANPTIEGATPMINVFYDGTHYQYLRRRAPSMLEASERSARLGW